MLLEVLGGAAEAVTIDRNVAAGIRLGGTLVAISLILGRAAAGDWHFWANTFADLGRLGWPALVLVVATAIVNRLGAPTPARPRPQPGWCGFLPATVLLALSLVYVVSIGAPKVAPPGRYPSGKVTRTQ